MLDNLQPLCHECHSAKTAREDGRWGKRAAVTIVCGPPGSGKTTYVRERMRWGDLVVDLDAIFVAISGLGWYEKPECLLPFAAEARDALLARLGQPSEVRHAWVIMSGARRADRQRLRSQLHGTVVVLEVPGTECMRRIALDERRATMAPLWKDLVDRWWREYEPDDADERIRPS